MGVKTFGSVAGCDSRTEQRNCHVTGGVPLSMQAGRHGVRRPYGSSNMKTVQTFKYGSEASYPGVRVPGRDIPFTSSGLARRVGISPTQAKSITEGRVRKRWNDLVETFAQRYGSRPSHIIRAPGRVNILGEHIDYSLFVCSPHSVRRSS